VGMAGTGTGVSVLASDTLRLLSWDLVQSDGGLGTRLPHFPATSRARSEEEAL
jgi:hypothetical protein